MLRGVFGGSLGLLRRDRRAFLPASPVLPLFCGLLLGFVLRSMLFWLARLSFPLCAGPLVLLLLCVCPGLRTRLCFGSGTGGLFLLLGWLLRCLPVLLPLGPRTGPLV